LRGSAILESLRACTSLVAFAFAARVDFVR
jgi:hypothetical protein